MTSPTRASGKRSIILETQSLSYATRERCIVQDISLQVPRGEVLAIVGPSGSGKTSFLRLLNRLDEPTGGKVLLAGRDYREIAPHILRSRIGMVMQIPVLFPDTVADNLQYGPRARGAELEAARLESLLSHVGLPGYANRSVHHLSTGEAQRVSLARALANSPEVLLLDEPTAPLDGKTKREVEQLISQIVGDENLTCLIVTHDLEQAARMASLVMVLENGKLAKIGAIDEVFHA
ncbi:MAG: phosphate ABC transporter ATP-binding protein [Acidobacteria bacterium]|nr:phosphate ABC transporter ATP-binding protein [Acidobacteriota bacterium]MCZ6768582.1 phosphate ABC transporter ATP-binding protein [Acidobacteriota bacterium]